MEILNIWNKQSHNNNSFACILSLCSGLWWQPKSSALAENVAPLAFPSTKHEEEFPQLAGQSSNCFGKQTLVLFRLTGKLILVSFSMARQHLNVCMENWELTPIAWRILSHVLGIHSQLFFLYTIWFKVILSPSLRHSSPRPSSFFPLHGFIYIWFLQGNRVQHLAPAWWFTTACIASSRQSVLFGPLLIPGTNEK